jgi:type II restriction enzyme
MAKKNLSKRLTNQHKESKGVVGIFGDEESSDSFRWWSY